MTEPHKIDVQEQLGQTKVEPPFVQRAGLALAALGVLVFLFLNYPSRDDDATEAGLAQRKALSEIAVRDATALFQTIVTQALLPVFTAILGYIFARGGREGGG